MPRRLRPSPRASQTDGEDEAAGGSGAADNNGQQQKKKRKTRGNMRGEQWAAAHSQAWQDFLQAKLKKCECMHPVKSYSNRAKAALWRHAVCGSTQASAAQRRLMLTPLHAFGRLGRTTACPFDVITMSCQHKSCRESREKHDGTKLTAINTNPTTSDQHLPITPPWCHDHAYPLQTPADVPGVGSRNNPACHGDGRRMHARTAGIDWRARTSRTSTSRRPR